MATISAINGVDIGNVAKINGIDIANIASVNGGDVVTADFVATIDATYVDSELTDFPIGIKLNAGNGFADYGATDWQYLHATVGGSECYVEVDVWDVSNNIAVLWVKVPTVSSSSDTVINLAITAVKNDFFVVASARTWDTFNGTDGDPPNTGFWTPAYTQHSTIDYGAELNSNALRMYLTGVAAAGSDTCKIDSKFRLSGDFDIQVEFQNLVHLNHVSAGFEIGIRFDNGYYALIKPQYNSGDQFFERFYTGSSSDATYSRTNDYGKLRISRTGSTITTYTIDGSGSTWTQRRSISVSSAECLVGFTLFDYNSGSEISCEADNFTINSCDSITGFIGETGDDAAKIVWDSNFVAVYHMSQDPSGGAGSILDSTSNGYNGTPYNSPTLVDSSIGKALLCGGSSSVKYVQTGNNDLSSIETTYTIESLHNYQATPGSYDDNVLHIGVEEFGAPIIIRSNATSKIGCAVWGDSVDSTYDGPYQTWGHVATTQAGGLLELFVDGVPDVTNTSSYSIPDLSNKPVTLGNSYVTAYTNVINYTGESRISSIVRSDAWIKATANNLLGNLLTIPIDLYHTVVIASGSGTSTMEYRDISTLGNFASFGDYRSGSPYDITARSNGSNQRGIYSGYNTGLPFSDTRIDYITINTPGNSADFGDLNLGVYSGAGFSNNTNERGIHANGTNQSSGSEINDIQYLTMSSLGNASDFGDMINTVSYCAGTDNGTNERGLKFGGTNTGTYYSNVEYITINSTGNGTAFGNLAYSIAEMSSFSNRENERGISSGGYWLSYRNVIQYWTVSTLSNAYDFGDLITAVSQCAGSSDGISERGMTLSGYTGSAYVVDIQYVTINSTGNASDFGDLATTHGKTGACSNA